MQDGYDQTLSGLLRKRGEIAATVQSARADLDYKLATLDALDAAIRIFAPDLAAEYLPVAKVVPIHGGATSEIRRFILDMMRQREGRYLRTMEAADALFAAKGVDVRDRVLRTLMRKRVSDAFGRMRKIGMIEGRRFGSGSELEWRLIN